MTGERDMKHPRSMATNSPTLHADAAMPPHAILARPRPNSRSPLLPRFLASNNRTWEWAMADRNAYRGFARRCASRATDETLRNVLLDLAREWDRTAHLTEATLLLSD